MGPATQGQAKISLISRRVPTGHNAVLRLDDSMIFFSSDNGACVVKPPGYARRQHSEVAKWNHHPAATSGQHGKSLDTFCNLAESCHSSLPGPKFPMSVADRRLGLVVEALGLAVRSSSGPRSPGGSSRRPTMLTPEGTLQGYEPPERRETSFPGAIE